MDDLKALAARTREIYDRHGSGFDRHRPKILHERNWLDRFSACIPAGGAILDLGCGAGEPIARYFLEAGFRVTGVDFSQTMIDLASARFPEGNWVLADMRELELGVSFDGIIGWNSFFHLTQEEQRLTLVHLARHLNPGGVLLLTVGPEAGEVAGQVEGAAVYHSSLSPREYRTCLSELGLEVVEFVAEDPECDMQTILMAKSMKT